MSLILNFLLKTTLTLNNQYLSQYLRMGDELCPWPFSSLSSLSDMLWKG